MFRLEMLPAAHGDCLWIEYGVGDQGRRILIDGGPGVTYPYLRDRVLHLPEGDRRFDLLVVTHIDADHIEGVIRLLQDLEPLGCEIDRIWFNGWQQLVKVPDRAGLPMGGMQGEFLGLLIDDLEERLGRGVLNLDFPDGIVGLADDVDRLPRIEGEWLGDCSLTLLSPGFDRLRDLKSTWENEVKEAGYRTGDADSLRTELDRQARLRGMGDVLGDEPAVAAAEFPDAADGALDPEALGVLGGGKTFGSDKGKANGSSIALLLEYPARDPEVTLLLAGDAWASELERSIRLLQGDSAARLALTGFKLPHHGSMSNMTESLLSLIRCKHFLVSTSGVIFGHPDSKTIELIREQQPGNLAPRFHFNYMTKTTGKWAEPLRCGGRKFESFYPKGLTVEM